MAKQQQAIEYFDGYGSPYDKYLIGLLERDTPMAVSGQRIDIKALDIENNEVVTFKSIPCPKCGKWLLKINNFCEHCGQKLKGD